MGKRLLLVIILISILLGFGTLRRGHEWGDDFAWYILQAKSVLNGTIDEFIETSAFTNNESTTYVGPLAYPWGYPLILLPAYALRGIHPLVLKLPGLLFYAAFLACLYLLMKRRLPQTESLLIVALFAFSPLLVQFMDQILSDIPFLFFSTLSLWLILKDDSRGILQNILIGVSIYFLVFIRATGILLLGCFFIVELVRLVKHRKEWTTVRQILLDSFIVGSTFILLWILNSVLFPSGGGSYLSQYAGMTVDTIRNFSVRYFNAYSSFFGETAGWRYLYYGLVIFFLIGVWRRWRQDLIFIVFFISWMLVHIAYPYWQGPRYIFPLLPIFIYFVFQGMRFALEKLPQKYARAGQWVFYGFWSMIIAVFLFNSSRNAYVNLQNDRDISGPFDPFSKEVYKYIQEETPADSVVIFFKPRVMKLMTNHETIMSTECERMFKGDYLVLSRKVGRNQQIPPEEIGVCNLPLSQVLRNNRFVVYEIQK
ncbi:MAG TPA: glycosyltransferase family 39 protein [Anaerolineales bacterium]|nr:glycosyltransferase family 39 protein [Anaerolineales bacterium]